MSRGLASLRGYQEGGSILDKLRRLWEGIRSKADDPSLGYIGASFLPGLGEATDLVEIGAGLQDRSLGRVGLGLAGFMIPFVGAPAIRKFFKGLPMDEASRLKRAEDMGFDLDVYHGTSSTEGLGWGDWDYLEPRSGSMRSRQIGQAGVSTTPLSEMASDFATSFRGVNSPGARMYPLKVRSKKIIPFLGPEWNKLQDEVGFGKNFDLFDHEIDRKSWHRVTAEARKRGWEGLQVRNEIIMFDPKNIRSRWAAFDPAKAGSRDLLAGIGGLAGTRYMLGQNPLGEPNG